MAKQKTMAATPQRRIGTILGTGFFLILSLIIVFPVFAGLLASFRPGTQLIRRGLSIDLDISTMNLNNYTYLFSGNADSQKYFMWYKNSLLITIISVTVTLLVCYFVAYGLTMYDFRLKNLLFTIVLATMMVPFEILLLPMYQMMIRMKLMNSYIGVIIPYLVPPFMIFFFRQYCLGIPRELMEAGRILERGNYLSEAAKTWSRLIDEYPLYENSKRAYFLPFIS